MPPNAERRPVGAASEVIAATKTMVAAGTDNAWEARPFAQRLHWRRRISRELDRLLGEDRYPDPSELANAARGR
jgi:hypothetical protein